MYFPPFSQSSYGMIHSLDQSFIVFCDIDQILCLCCNQCDDSITCYIRQSLHHGDYGIDPHDKRDGLGRNSDLWYKQGKAYKIPSRIELSYVNELIENSCRSIAPVIGSW